MIDIGVPTLVVDDSAVIRKLIASRLEAIGCSIVGEAKNAREALRLFRQCQPSIVSLDLAMPEPDGLTAEVVFQTIRSERPEVSIIVISASPKSATAASYLARGAIAYFEKPFINFDQLREKLELIYPLIRSHSN
jgi:two-component system chemotaxis response regulator CheY